MRLALSGLLGPRTSEDASHHVDVPFVARELMDVVLGCAQAHDGSPWFHPTIGTISAVYQRSTITNQ
jgi:hypothetical protein